MHIVYIDDSGDEVLSAFSALVVPADQWKQCFAKIKQFRTDLRKSDGIYVKKELHAWKFVSGRGRIAPTRIKIERRVARRIQTESHSLTRVAESPWWARLITAVSALIGLAGAVFVGLLALTAGEDWMGPIISPWLRGVVILLCIVGAFSCFMILVRSFRR